MQVGDFVRYRPGGDVEEIGRVASFGAEGRVFVCFSSGCTASACSEHQLVVIKPTEALIGRCLGYHRFDDHCPEFNPVACYCCADKERSA